MQLVYYHCEMNDYRKCYGTKRPLLKNSRVSIFPTNSCLRPHCCRFYGVNIFHTWRADRVLFVQEILGQMLMYKNYSRGVHSWPLRLNYVIRTNQIDSKRYIATLAAVCKHPVWKRSPMETLYKETAASTLGTLNFLFNHIHS